MKKRMFLLSIFTILIIISGCFSDKKEEKKIEEKKITATAASKEFAIALSDVGYTTSGGGVMVTVTISAANNTTAGNIYYVVSVTQSAVTPTSEQIRTGRTPQWKPYYKSGNIATTGGCIETIVIDGLTPGTQYDIFLGADDSQGNIIKTVTKLHITADTTPPDITTLAAVALTETTATVVVTQDAINVNGKIYYVLLANGAATPSAVQVKALQNASGSTSAAIKSAIVTTNTTAQALSITGLTRYTDYELYVVSEDFNRNLQTTPSTIHIKTKDITPPVYSTPAAVVVTSTSAIIKAQLNEAGTIYYAVFPNGTVTPTPGAVKAGTGTTTEGSITTAGIAVESITISGISYDKQYELFVVAEDVSGNLQKSTTKLHIGADFTPPTTSDVSAAAITITETTAVVSLGIGEKGKVYYVVLPNGTSTPSAATVKAAGLVPTTTKGSVTLSGTSNQNLTITGLTRYTAYELFVAGEDAVGNLQTTTPAWIHIQTVDTTAPVYTTTSTITVTSTSAIVKAQLDEAGTIYYAVFPSGTATQTPAVVKAGTGTTTKGSITTAGIALESITISGITYDKQYEVFIVAEDNFANLQKAATKIHIGSDFTPPVIADTSFTAVTLTETTAVITAGLKEQGKIYYVVLPNGTSTPSAATIKAAGLVPTTTKGSVSLTSANNQNFTITGLTRFTDYEVYGIGEDTVGNLQTTVSGIHIKTTDITAPVNTSAPAITMTTGTAVLNVKYNEDVTVYYGLFANGTSTKTPAEVIAGTGAVTTYAAVTAAALTVKTVTLSGISYDTEYELFVVAKDLSSNNTQTTATKVHVYSDQTPPASMTLTASAITETTAKISVGLGEKGKVYYVLTASGAATPSAVQVKAGQNSTGGSIAVNGVITISGTSSQDFTLSSLTPLTNYKMFIVGEDYRANLQTTVSSIAVNTIDSTPPVNTTNYPAKVSVTTATAVIQVSINEAGTVYYEVVAKGTVHTPAQIIAATTASSICGNVSVAAATVQTITISGLTINTNYDILVTAKDSSGNLQKTTAAKVTINTASNVATLKATSTVKGEVVTLGTPASTADTVVAGSVTITSGQAINTSNATNYITLFDKTDSTATVKVVKYATGSAITNFATATAYNNEAIADKDFFIVRVTAQDATTINYYKVIVTRTDAPSAVATLKSTSTVKGVTVTSLGTDIMHPGAVTISYEQSRNTSNAGSYITLFDKTNAFATTKVVKYTSQAAITGFDTDTAYNGTAVIADKDFFIVEVIAQDSVTTNYYKVIVTVTPASTVATLTNVVVKGVTTSALGTPASTSSGSIVAGTVTITTAQAITGAGITATTTESHASVTKVVKYASGATPNFDSDTAYNNSDAIVNNDFFIIEVTAENGTTKKYYEIDVTVSP